MPGNPKDSKWRNTSDAKRHRKHVNLTLSEEAHEKLDRLAVKAGGKSAAVEQLIIEAPDE